MKSNQRNDQLERFFQHNPIEDPLYLKKYVKEHPDHKMAWYLLGREYMAQGKEGKAAYCFAQAGEIYEAFEHQKIVIEGPMPVPLTASTLTKELSPKVKQSKRKGKWLLILFMLILLAMPDGIDIAKSEAGDGKVVTQPQPIVVEDSKNLIPKGETADLSLVFAKGDWGKTLEGIIKAPRKGEGESVIVDSPSSTDGKWKEWNRAVTPLLSVDKTGTAGSEVVLRYYQAQICSCQVSDSSKLAPVIQSWVQEREVASIMQSAIQAYQSINGELPEKAEQLTRPYPANLLPGLTPQMKEAFPSSLSRISQKSSATAVPNAKSEAAAGQDVPATKDATASSEVSSSSKSLADPLSEPLRIVIDTEQHQLALVSGEFILRRYKVGLGGAKTPQGDFIISEKVRNPNGKSNGEFGSRGMTLSQSLYAIHGTNNPSSIGKDESHGCVRMLQADVEELYDMVPQQTKVTIGKGVLPPVSSDSGLGAGGGDPNRVIRLPLETKDNNPGKRYAWLD